jgi:hypothetical protein
MRRPLFWLLILFAATMLRAEGPVFRHKDGKVDQEFEQVYQDLRSVKPKRGVTDGSDATAGFVGEYTSSTTATYANCAATTQYGNVVSMSLTAGDWDLTGQIQFTLNGATANADFIVAVSTFSGNTTTDHVAGKNFLNVATPTAANNSGGNVSHRLNLTSTQTVYLKGRAGYSAGTPQMLGTLFARRVR